MSVPIALTELQQIKKVWQLNKYHRYSIQLQHFSNSRWIAETAQFGRE